MNQTITFLIALTLMWICATSVFSQSPLDNCRAVKRTLDIYVDTGGWVMTEDVEILYGMGDYKRILKPDRLINIDSSSLRQLPDEVFRAFCETYGDEFRLIDTSRIIAELKAAVRDSSVYFYVLEAYEYEDSLLTVFWSLDDYTVSCERGEPVIPIHTVARLGLLEDYSYDPKFGWHLKGLDAPLSNAERKKRIRKISAFCKKLGYYEVAKMILKQAKSRN